MDESADRSSEIIRTDDSKQIVRRCDENTDAKCNGQRDAAGLVQET